MPEASCPGAGDCRLTREVPSPPVMVTEAAVWCRHPSSPQPASSISLQLTDSFLWNIPFIMISHFAQKPEMFPLCCAENEREERELTFGAGPLAPFCWWGNWSRLTCPGSHGKFAGSGPGWASFPVTHCSLRTPRPLSVHRVDTLTVLPGQCLYWEASSPLVLTNMPSSVLMPLSGLLKLSPSASVLKGTASFHFKAESKAHL